MASPDKVTSDPTAQFKSLPVRKKDQLQFEISGSECLTLTQRDASQGNAVQLVWIPPIQHQKTSGGASFSDVRGLYQDLNAVRAQFINRSSQPLEVQTMVPLAKESDNKNVYKHMCKNTFTLAKYGDIEEKMRKKGPVRGRNVSRKNTAATGEMYKKSLFIETLYYTIRSLMLHDYNEYTLCRQNVAVNGTTREGLVLCEFYAVIPDISDQTGAAINEDQKYLQVKVSVDYTVSENGALPGTTAEQVPGLVVTTTPFNTFWLVQNVVDPVARALRDLKVAGVTTIQYPDRVDERSVTLRPWDYKYRLEYTSGNTVHFPAYNSEDIRAFPIGLGLARMPESANGGASTIIAQCKWHPVDNCWYLYDDAAGDYTRASTIEYRDAVSSSAPVMIVDTRPDSVRMASARASTFLDTVISVTQTIGEIISVGQTILGLFV